MKIISVVNLDDYGWQKYFNMSVEIFKKYNPDKKMVYDTWQKYKAEKLNNFYSCQDVFFNEHVIFNNDLPVAWLDYASTRYGSGFSFDTVYDEVPEDLLKEVLKIIYKFVINNSLENIEISEYSKRKIETFNKINIDYTEELLLSRLERKDMNEIFYQSIISNFRMPDGFELRYLNEIPNWLIDDHADFMNEIFVDINNLNPVKQNNTYFSKEEWLRIWAMNKSNGSEMHSFILLDENKKISGLNIVYTDRNFRDNIRQTGGITAVRKKFRGMGMGRFLKAKMYLKMLKVNNDFKYITTDTAPWNSYMFRINEEFGFKAYKHGYKFIITKDFLLNYIK